MCVCAVPFRAVLITVSAVPVPVPCCKQMNISSGVLPARNVIFRSAGDSSAPRVSATSGLGSLGGIAAGGVGGPALSAAHDQFKSMLQQYVDKSSE